MSPYSGQTAEGTGLQLVHCLGWGHPGGPDCRVLSNIPGPPTQCQEHLML